MSLAFRRYLRRFLIIVAVLGMAFLLPAVSSAYPAHLAQPVRPAHPLSGPAPQLKVVGNQLVDKNTGQVIVLHGMDRNGTQSACNNQSQSWDNKYHVFPDKNGPTTVEISAMKTNWGVNAVRIPLNEDCWLNKEMPTGDKIGGATYINGIKAYVNLLNQAGVVAILDLHYSASAGYRAYKQDTMPDASYSLSFWTSVASTFAGNDAVVFDAFSEPAAPVDPNNGFYDAPSWTCWLKGQTFPGDNNTCATGCVELNNTKGGTVLYNCVGMQSVVQTIRTAANPAPDNVIILGGLDYAKVFSYWSQYLPIDPNTGHAYTNLAVGAHIYSFFYYDQPDLTNLVKNGYPVIAGEIGGGTVNQKGYTQDTFLLTTMGYLDDPSGGTHSLPAQSYLAWHWNPDNTDHMAMITDWTSFGPSTCYGQAYQAHLTGGTPPTCP